MFNELKSIHLINLILYFSALLNFIPPKTIRELTISIKLHFMFNKYQACIIGFNNFSLD